MLHELQAVIKPAKRLNASINVSVTTIERNPLCVGKLIPNFKGVKGIVGSITFPYLLVDSEGYSLLDYGDYLLMSSEAERSE